MDLKDIINGTCRKAINDERGNNILETYQKKLGIGEFIGNIDLISKNSVCLCWSIKCEGTFPLDNMVCILKTENYEEAGDTQAFVFQTALPVDGENEGRCFIRKKDLVEDEVSASDWHEIPSDATINKFEINFDSEDDENPVAWTSMRKIVSGKIKDLFGNVSIMAKNIRWLYKMLGTTNIASIGGGTLTGAISKLNTDLSYKDIKNEITILKEGTTFDSAYVKNGIVWITGRAPAGTTEMVTQIAKISAPYAPRTDMRGFPSCNATTEDIGKMSSICMRASGKMDIFFKAPLDYAEIFIIIYPLK